MNDQTSSALERSHSNIVTYGSRCWRPHQLTTLASVMKRTAPIRDDVHPLTASLKRTLAAYMYRARQGLGKVEQNIKGSLPGGPQISPFRNLILADGPGRRREAGHDLIIKGIVPDLLHRQYGLPRCKGLVSMTNAHIIQVTVSEAPKHTHFLSNMSLEHCDVPH